MRWISVVVGVVVAAAVWGPARDAAEPPVSGAPALQAVRTQQARAGSRHLAHFPATVGKAKCQIPAGGITANTFEGTCQTTVAQDGDGWLVNFTQMWDAAYFREGHSPATGQLRHTWQFRVDAQGQVSEQHGFGDFPPQLVK